VDTTKKPNLSHISLCFGYGGIDLGLHNIFGDRLRLAAVCEIEAFALENALSKMEAGLIPAAPIWTDLRTFPWEEFQDVSLVSGGFPCQPFSAAGKREGDQDPRHLFPFIVDGIKRCRPRFVFLENVEGILSSKLAGEGWADPAGTPVLLHVLRELERVGYKATAGIFSASEVGAPHQRKRIFILAYRKEQGLEGLRRLESDFIWNDAWQDGAARGEELAYSCDSANTEAGYAEANRLSSEHRTKVCSGFIGGTDATAKELVYPINDDGSNVSRVKFGQKEQPIFGESSVNVAGTNNGRSRKDIQSTKSRASWIEQPSFNCGGLQSREIREEQAWPSRPGQPQYAWEPPRVVGGELADTNDAGRQARWNNSIPDGGGSGSHRTTSHCSNQAGAVEDTICSGGEESEYQQANLPSEPSGSDSEIVGDSESGRAGECGNKDSQREGPRSTWASPIGDMGNTEQLLFPATGEHGAMDEESGIPTDGEGSETAQADSEPGATRKREDNGSNASKCGKAQQPMGDSTHGTESRLGISELSGLSDSELDEIREWMVRCDNRTDELRLLGNGVVPATAARAFLTLLEKLK
jgi:DNA-cytosine methyltransferase